MPSSWKGKTPPQKPDFADWKDHGEESLKAARAVAVKFRDDVVRLEAIHDRAGYALTLCGISGTGKTFLGNCILNEIGRDAWGNLNNVQGYIRGNQLVRGNYMRRDWRKLSDGFKSGQFEILDDLESAFLVMLDDIGADYDPSGMGTSKLDRVLRSRTGKWTILTCNLTLNQIADGLDTRIASFLIRDGNRVCEIKAQDYATRPATVGKPSLPGSGR